jgi:hypothetical protein
MLDGKHGLLAGLAEIDQLRQTEGISWGEAWELWHRAKDEAASNVIHVDFRGSREAD